MGLGLAVPDEMDGQQLRTPAVVIALSRGPLRKDPSYSPFSGQDTLGEPSVAIATFLLFLMPV